MKKALLKDSIKEIKNTYKRFISILLMAFLGVGFFAGLRASPKDMIETIDKYYDEQNVYDIRIVSTLGLTDEDISELSKIESIEGVYGSYETDGKIQTENNEIITRLITLIGANTPIVLEGRIPKSENECLVESKFLKNANKKIGDTIQVDIENITNDYGENVQVLKNNELTIVGTIKSPLYISKDRGTSYLGDGIIDYYMYISKENINIENFYTDIYVSVKDGKKYTTSKNDYEDYVEDVKNNIEKIKEQRENSRQEELKNKIQGNLIGVQNVEIEKPKWYILDRNANSGYVGFIQDTKSVENISAVFPIVFFLVATLISLTSMTRMVEEHRMRYRNTKSIRV